MDNYDEMSAYSKLIQSESKAQEDRHQSCQSSLENKFCHIISSSKFLNPVYLRRLLIVRWLRRITMEEWGRH